MPYQCRRNPNSNLNLDPSHNTFVAQSISSVYSSKIKISPDGQRNVKSVNNIEERHLRAEPALPTLEERATMSNNKNLYKLSQQLAEVNKDDRRDNDFEQRKIYYDNKHQSKRNLNLKEKCHSKHFPDSDRDSDKCQDSEKRKRKQLTRRKSRGTSLHDSFTQDNVNNYIKKQVRLLTLKRYAEDGECDCETLQNIEDRSIEDQDNISSVRSRLSEAAVAPRTKTTWRQVKMFIDRGTDPIEETEFLQSLNLKLNNFAKNKSQVSSFGKIFNKIDDFYIYTLFLHLGLLAYLVYILFIDINHYVNEEQRYLAKMRSSSLPLKCFYYLMRLLNVYLF